MYTDRRKFLPKGPRPRNTLSKTPFPRSPAVKQKAALIPNPKGGTQQALAVEIHKGSNVESTTKTSERDELLPTPPSAKRRKLDHQASPASSGQTDPLDQLSPNEISFHASQGTSQYPSQAPSRSVNSQTSALPMRRSGSFEYRKVQGMMDPKPKSKKQRRRDNQGYQPDLGLLPSSPKRSPKHSSMSHPIDISGDESQFTNLNCKEAPRPAYRGTARQQPTTVSGTRANTSKPLKDRPGATQSPYFNRPTLPSPRSTGNVKQKLIAQSSSRERSPGLAQKFVAVDGKRRGSDVNASSDADELQSVPTTVGQNADPNTVFSTKDMGSNSPSKQSSSTLKATSSTDDLVVWAPSTIKSDFVRSDAKSGTSRRPSRPVPLDQETKPPWAVDIAAISLPGILIENEDLGLVYDEKQKAYFIQMCGLPYRSTHSSLRIQPQKLIKVLWENTGSKVRLESSRNGTEDNVLDLEVRSERDLQALLRRLQSSNSFSIKGKNR